LIHLEVNGCLWQGMSETLNCVLGDSRTTKKQNVFQVFEFAELAQTLVSNRRAVNCQVLEPS
jgi:hypothetical protein